MLVGIVFDSEIIAHEDMNVYSYVGLLEGVAKLVIVYMISCASIDKLFLYALLLLFVTIITQVIYLVYSKRHYSECYIRFVYDKSVLKVFFTKPLLIIYAIIIQQYLTLGKFAI